MVMDSYTHFTRKLLKLLNATFFNRAVQGNE